MVAVVAVLRLYIRIHTSIQQRQTKNYKKRQRGEGSNAYGKWYHRARKGFLYAKKISYA